MASGGRDESENNLDLSEIMAEIGDLETSTESEYKDCSLTWEVTKADQEYEDIAASKCPL